MPRNSMPEHSKRTVDVSIRLRAFFNSAPGKVLHYLKENSSINAESTHLSMLVTFWHPFAARATGTSKHDARFLALTSVHNLMSHIDFICEEFNLSRPYKNYQESVRSNTDIDVNANDLLNPAKHNEESAGEPQNEFSGWTPPISDNFENFI
jgi:hypothetical protein